MSQTLRFNSVGHIACLCTEAIDLRSPGRLAILRATDICFCERTQLRKVRCDPIGKLVHCDPSREACLLWERDNLGPSATDTAPLTNLSSEVINPCKTRARSFAVQLTWNPRGFSLA